MENKSIKKSVKTKELASQSNGVFVAKHMLAPISLRKVQPVANFIRGKDFSVVSTYLKFSPYKSAGLLLKVLNSASANAKNKGEIGNLYVKDVVLGDGVSRKSGRFGGKGSVKPLIKRTTNISVLLSKLPEVKGGQNE